MTPREVVTAAVEFRRPDRLPIRGYGDRSDLDGLGYEKIRPPEAGDDESVDHFLCRWAKTETPNMGQVKGHPLADMSRLKDFPWPDSGDPRWYAETPAQLARLKADPARRDKYVCMGIFMLLWERIHSLRGFENSMIDLMDDRREIHEIADRIVDYDLALIRNMHRICGGAIQGLSFTDDWGTQVDVHVSPELWRRFFMPRYRKIFDAAHERGWHLWMHSCGKINKILPALIELGLDVINMQQPRTNGIERIGRHFGGKICFETLCDIQRTLPTGDHGQIVAEAEMLLEHWAQPAGGFVLGDYGDHVGIGAAPETKEFMLETFLRLDPYKKAGP